MLHRGCIESQMDMQMDNLICRKKCTQSLMAATYLIRDRKRTRLNHTRTTKASNKAARSVRRLVYEAISIIFSPHHYVQHIHVHSNTAHTRPCRAKATQAVYPMPSPPRNMQGVPSFPLQTKRINSSRARKAVSSIQDPLGSLDDDDYTINDTFPLFSSISNHFPSISIQVFTPGLVSPIRPTQFLSLNGLPELFLECPPGCPGGGNAFSPSNKSSKYALGARSFPL